jgi:hypothetical protein
MTELSQFEKQDLINLQKVVDIERKDDASYELNGTVRSMYQRNEKGYRVQVKGSSEVYLFVFSSTNKTVAVVGGVVPTEPSQ